MEIKCKNYFFHLEEKQINGITGKELKEIEEIILFQIQEKILVNKKEIKGIEKYQIQKRIEIVEENIIIDNYYKNVYEWLENEIKNKKTYPRNIPKKIQDAIKIVGLEETILEKGILECSLSEKKKLQIAISLLSNPDILILKDPFKVLDLNNSKLIKNMLTRFAEKYKKIIIIISNNPNLLYQITNHIIIVKNKKVLIEGSTKEIYEQGDFLIKNKIDLPDIVEITYLARTKKNIKIDYHKDVRDIIKDIYKHVKR